MILHLLWLREFLLTPVGEEEAGSMRGGKGSKPAFQLWNVFLL